MLVCLLECLSGGFLALCSFHGAKSLPVQWCSGAIFVAAIVVHHAVCCCFYQQVTVSKSDMKLEQSNEDFLNWSNNWIESKEEAGK